MAVLFEMISLCSGRTSQRKFPQGSIVSLGYEEAMVAGDILAKLQRTGRMIGVEDILIAATAMHHGCTVVTGNIRHFGRIEGLRVENWLEPS